MIPRRRSGKETRRANSRYVAIKPTASGNRRGRSSGKADIQAPEAQVPAERWSSLRVTAEATPPAAGQEYRRVSSDTVRTPRGSPPSETCSLPLRIQGKGPSDTVYSRSGNHKCGIGSSPSENVFLLFGDGDQGEEDEHPKPKRANRRLFQLHGRKPEGEVDESVQASAAEIDEVTQTQVLEGVIVLTRRESVAGSLPIQACSRDCVDGCLNGDGQGNVFLLVHCRYS